MSDPRVSKNWQQTGLDGVPTAALLGTLQHYGVATSEESFKKEAETLFPLQMVRNWLPSWKGTGQFGKYPLAAADELWKRLSGDKLNPSDYAAAIAALLKTLQSLLADDASAPIEKSFQAVRAFHPRLPKTGDKVSEEFVEETFARLGEKGSEIFNEMAEKMAKAGHADDADAYGELEEFLFPERQGVIRAMVKALSDDKPGGIASLKELASSDAADSKRRIMALDALIHIGELDEAQVIAENWNASMNSKANPEAPDIDLHLAIELVHRLAFIAEKNEDRAGLQKYIEQMDALDEAHHKAHPHHKSDSDHS